MNGRERHLEFARLVQFRLREFVALGQGANLETTKLALEALNTVLDEHSSLERRNACIHSAASLLRGKPWTKAGALLSEVRRMERNWERYRDTPAPTVCSTVREHLWAASMFGDLPSSQKQFSRILDIAPDSNVQAAAGKIG